MDGTARTRDPEAKRQKLLEAALVEFSTHGLAGARIDRIAKAAGVSAGLVYSFHAGKDELFDAVFDHIVELTISAVPMDADDLPDYAARLYEAGRAHPEVLRFVTWYRLERGSGTGRASASASMKKKVAAIKAAQRRGTVTREIPPGEILALVLATSSMWDQPAEDVARLVPKSRRRKTIVDAVARLVDPTR